MAADGVIAVEPEDSFLMWGIGEVDLFIQGRAGIAKTKLVMSQDQAKALIREAVIWWTEDDEKAQMILEEMGIEGG